MSPHKKTFFIIAVSLISGILVSSAAFSYISSVDQQPKAADAIGLHDLVILKAYHANGELFYSALGHNNLTIVLASVLAACATGNNPNGVGGGTISCDSFIGSLYISNTTDADGIFACGNPSASGHGCSILQTVSSSIPTVADSYPNPLPSSTCNLSLDGCDGWNSTAIFSGFTAPFVVASAGAGFGYTQPSGSQVAAFDYIDLCTSPGSNTPAGCQQSQVTLNPGDSISVTIVFLVAGLF